MIPDSYFDSFHTAKYQAKNPVQRFLIRRFMAKLIELFDPDKYANEATVGENLLFGTPVGETFQPLNMVSNDYLRETLRKAGLEDLLVEKGMEMAETTLGLFQDLPPDIFQLGLYGFPVIVIEPMALPGHFDPHSYHQAIGIGFIQDFKRRTLPVFSPPGAKRIAIVCSQGRDVAKFEACPFDVKGFPVYLKGIFNASFT